MDTDGEMTTGADGPFDFRLRSLVRTNRVENDINEHRRPDKKLADSFLGVNHLAALVLATLGADAMGLALLVAVRALGEGWSREEVVRAAQGRAALRVAAFRIRHFFVPFICFATVLRMKKARMGQFLSNPESDSAVDGHMHSEVQGQRFPFLR
jgi:hypothetical protein